MTRYIAPRPPEFATECDYVNNALLAYDTGDGFVSLIEKTRRGQATDRRDHLNLLRSQIQSIENNLWEALARDYPKFKFRRQNQTIVVNYGTANVIYINPGEVYKIQAWGVNDYYEALDTINRLQGKLWNYATVVTRRWKDDWKRLERQLKTINRRNCQGRTEVKPGPIIITPPPTIPAPPYICGPELPVYPGRPIPIQGNWSTADKRNWAIPNWNDGDIFPLVVGYVINRPSIYIIDGREFIFYKTPGTNPTKLLWLFHGTDGSARSWFTDYEKVNYVKKFIDAGYAVCAYESFNRLSKKWAPSANTTTNREIIGLKNCQQLMINQNLVPAICTASSQTNPYTGTITTFNNCSIAISQFGVGMSAGGGMVSYAAGSLGLSKVAIHNASGLSAVIQNASYNVDTLWMISTNDTVINSTDASVNYNYLLTNKPSLTTQYYNQPGTKITSAIFDAIPNISTVVANAIVAGLVSNGFIVSGGALTSKYSSAGRLTRQQYIQNDIPVLIGTAFGNDTTNYHKYLGDIIDQIKISFSDHEFSGWQRTENAGVVELVERDLAFFNLP
jgi:hypothetical protein